MRLLELPTVTDRTPRPGDAALRFVTGRRPVLEWTAAAMAAEEPRVTIRRGVRAWELLTGASAIQGSPHVIGVQTTSGEIMHADLVVDAMGRRSHAGEWIKAVGGRSPHEEHEDNTFLYYTRYFTGPRRPRRLGRALTPMGIFSILTFDGDAKRGTVSMVHANVPDHDAAGIRSGWPAYYWRPWKAYLEKGAAGRVRKMGNRRR